MRKERACPFSIAVWENTFQDQRMELDAEPKQAIKKPFLKWAGAKTKLVKTLAAYYPAGKLRFVEPFVGAGAAFLNSRHERSLLCDTNADLINLYRILQRE